MYVGTCQSTPRTGFHQNRVAGLSGERGVTSDIRRPTSDVWPLATGHFQLRLGNACLSCKLIASDQPAVGHLFFRSEYLWIRHLPSLKTARFISLTLLAKRPRVASRFFGVSWQGQQSSRPIFTAGPLTTLTFAGNFIPATAANLLVNDHQGPMSDQKAKSGLLLRRRNKFVGFIIAEAAALGLLLIAGTFALSLKPANPDVAWSINIATIIAAAAVVFIPIIYFAIAPVLPHDNRRGAR